jgi:S-adenosylmethionine decarboxylase
MQWQAHEPNSVDAPTNYVVYGQHLVMDLGGCDLAAIADRDTIVGWVTDLVKKIEMVAYGDPIVEHFGHADPKTSGYTAVQLIETSSITAHFSDHLRSAHIDVFSCRDFTVADAMEFSASAFGATTGRYTWLHR